MTQTELDKLPEWAKAIPGVREEAARLAAEAARRRKLTAMELSSIDTKVRREQQRLQPAIDQAQAEVTALAEKLREARGRLSDAQSLLQQAVAGFEAQKRRLESDLYKTRPPAVDEMVARLRSAHSHIINTRRGEAAGEEASRLVELIRRTERLAYVGDPAPELAEIEKAAFPQSLPS